MAAGPLIAMVTSEQRMLTTRPPNATAIETTNAAMSVYQKAWSSQRITR